MRPGSELRTFVGKMARQVSPVRDTGEAWGERDCNMRPFTTRKAFDHIHNVARGIMNMRSFGACVIAMMVPCVSSAQIYPGTLCVESGNAATVLRYGTSFVFHTSATTKPLLCPVVRHTGGDVEAWSLTVDRNGATANWTAFLVSAN